MQTARQHHEEEALFLGIPVVGFAFRGPEVVARLQDARTDPQLAGDQVGLFAAGMSVVDGGRALLHSDEEREPRGLYGRGWRVVLAQDGEVNSGSDALFGTTAVKCMNGDGHALTMGSRL